MEEILKQILKAVQHPITDVQSVNLSDAAKILDVQYAKLKTLIDAGLIRCMVLNRCTYRIPIREIRRFEEQWIGYDLSDPWNPIKIEEVS